MKKIIRNFSDYVIYWSIPIIPFSVSIASAAMNIFMGFLIFFFILKRLQQKKVNFPKTAINLPLLFLFIVTCLSLVNSINYRDSIKGGILRLLQYIFILFILIEEIKDRNQIKNIIFFIVAGLILVSIDEIWQIATGHDFIRGYSPIVNIGLLRATASFKDANTLGIYLSALAPFIFGLSLFYYKGVKKIIFIFLSLIIFLGIVLTYSRPTLLAIYISLFFLGAVERKKILIIFLIALTLISPFLLPKSVKEWAKQVEYNPLRFMCNDDRIAIYRNSLNMIKAHPIIGIGANTFMKNYRKYKESPEYRNIVTSDYLYAHNNFLHMAGEIGLVGLGIFFWFLYTLFKECKMIYKNLNDNFLKIISLSVITCLISFLINGLTESSLYYSRVAMIFWYLIGFSLALKKFISFTKK
jgi:O-antigen ligase